MKRASSPFQKYIASVLLISFLLQSCGGSDNLPMEGEEEATEAIELEEQGRRKRPRIKIEVEEQEQNLIEQQRGVSSFDILPLEIWQEVFSYLDFKGVLAARSVNSDWNELITGSRQAGIVGVENKPSHIVDARSWVKREGIDFRNKKLKKITPATIPSFAFYHLMGHVSYLPQSFWPHLLGTQVHTFNFSFAHIGVAGAIELAKALPGTQLHTLDLRWSRIGAVGAIELAKALPNTQVHTLDLSGNQIGAAGAIELAKALPNTQVHTLNLGANQIGDATQQLLKHQYPHINWIF